MPKAKSVLKPVQASLLFYNCKSICIVAVEICSVKVLVIDNGSSQLVRPALDNGSSQLVRPTLDNGSSQLVRPALDCASSDTAVCTPGGVTAVTEPQLYRCQAGRLLTRIQVLVSLLWVTVLCFRYCTREGHSDRASIMQ